VLAYGTSFLDNDGADPGVLAALDTRLALALEPKILLLDEPTASLDFRAAGRIEELLLKLKEKYTILAVSHSLSETRRLADRVCVLREGRIVHELDREHLQDPAVFHRLVDAAF